MEQQNSFVEFMWILWGISVPVGYMHDQYWHPPWHSAVPIKIIWFRRSVLGLFNYWYKYISSCWWINQSMLWNDYYIIPWLLDTSLVLSYLVYRADNLQNDQLTTFEIIVWQKVPNFFETTAQWWHIFLLTELSSHNLNVCFLFYNIPKSLYRLEFVWVALKSVTEDISTNFSYLNGRNNFIPPLSYLSWMLPCYIS